MNIRENKSSEEEMMPSPGVGRREELWLSSETTMPCKSEAPVVVAGFRPGQLKNSQSIPLCWSDDVWQCPNVTGVLLDAFTPAHAYPASVLDTRFIGFNTGSIRECEILDPN